MATNYDDVVSQLTASGLLIDRLIVGKMTRCKVEGDRERRGWYSLHEVTLAGGDQVLVGSYGIWYGDDNGARKIELTRQALSDEQKAALKTRLREDRKRAEQARVAEAARASERADAAWRKCAITGDSDYLTRKAIGAHGVRYSPSGALVVPMCDAGGRVKGLQFILSRAAHADRIKRTGRDKEYWPAGMDKRGAYHLIGGTPTWLVLVAEGYATAASAYEATGIPVAAAFDAGNLQPVAEALHKRYPRAKILLLGDDDRYGKCRECKAPVKVAEPICPGCGKEHRCTNAGADRAAAAALAVGGSSTLPLFADDDARWAAFRDRGVKLTDYNDLHAESGLLTVRTQIEDKLRYLSWAPPTAAPAKPQGGGERDALRPIDSLDELLERYALVYAQKGTVFDREEHCLLALSDMRDACISRELHRRWAEHPGRQIVRVREVGFDPGGEDPEVTCNLWDKWPTSPREGSCERLLEVLRYMCGNEGGNAQHLYEWVLNWLAYPIQHPGAKMKSTVVIHGPQGTGKNLFFECIMAIYGQYGRVIDQSAIEDKFNDWSSRKLFLIADEVVARSDLYHVKNKLKAFITGDWIRINPKNYAAYDERNHVNLVFLSNEVMPVVLEKDDRRHAIIWTPPKLSQAFYSEVRAEIKAGGIAALHHYLLNRPLGQFEAGTEPPMTQAKADLIELSKDSITRFADAWAANEIDGLPPMPAITEDLFAGYRVWSGRQGVSKPASLPTMIGTIGKRPGYRKGRHLFLDGQIKRQGVFIFPPGDHRPGPAEHESVWLGRHAEAFRNAVSDYRGRYAA